MIYHVAKNGSISDSCRVIYEAAENEHVILKD